MNHVTTTHSLASRVRSVLLELDLPGVDAAAIEPDSLLIEHLGMDSLRFVDLTVRLEQALGIAVFPMQEWVDECFVSGSPLSVGSLVQACEHAVDGAAAAQSAA